MIEQIIKPFAALAYVISKHKEKRLGYRLDFVGFPHDWLQANVVVEMDKHWQKEGLDAIGTNYFTLGSTQNGLSTRFDPGSAYYQAWLGGYIVRFSNKKHGAFMIILD